MKKQLLIVGITVLLIAVGLSGCTQQNENDNNGNGNNQENEVNDYFACEEIIDASYSAELGGTQWFSIGFKGIGLGQYMNNEWAQHTGKNTNLEQIWISFGDSYTNNGIEYPGGILTIRCGDGTTIEVYLPNFTDVEGEGLVDENGIEFTGRFYVANDGSTYYDEDLTILAKSA